MTCGSALVESDGISGNEDSIRYHCDGCVGRRIEGAGETYFQRGGTAYVFDKDLRRPVIFGVHDVVQSAPISHFTARIVSAGRSKFV
jgi:hypothetical protein